MSFPPSQKFKDACDMCSASKVKCDKERPMCGRCGKLVYPCFYSPARRMGRPHPSRQTASQHRSGPVDKKPKRQYPVQHGDESNKPQSNACPDEAQKAVEAGTREKLIGRPREFENELPYDSVYQGSTILQNKQMYFPQPDHYSFGDPAYSKQINPSGNTTTFNFDYHCQALSSDSTSTVSSPTHNHSRSTSRVRDSSPSASEVPEDSLGNTPEYDCATSAMTMLQHLNKQSTKRLCRDLSNPTADTESLHALIDITSMAIKRVSIIIVCPCAQKTDVGLLVAAVCAAILEAFELILRKCPKTNSPYPTTLEPTQVTMPLLFDKMRDAEGKRLYREPLQESPDVKVDMTRVLNELPKAANLVMQFSKRYSQGIEHCSGEILSALAISLKSKVRSITNEATDRVAQT
ncbi:hypothetical protein MMC17_004268 [Xylographa soralifera]|nr:hypothetical protein [Xylographa soralifera]